MYIVSIKLNEKTSFTVNCKDLLDDKMFPHNVILVGLLAPLHTKYGEIKNAESWSLSRESILDVICGEVEPVVESVPEVVAPETPPAPTTQQN